MNNTLLIVVLILCSLIVIMLSLAYFQKVLQWVFKKDLFSKLGSSAQIRVVHQLHDACAVMSNEKIGALITIELKTSLEHLRTDGHILDANISSSLLIAIFNKTSPLHDGAVIIKSSKIKYAGTFYKITQSSLSNKYGARHRAAVGISEQSDSLTIVVSEETGAISFCMEGQVKKIEINEFQERMFEFLK